MVYILLPLKVDCFEGLVCELVQNEDNTLPTALLQPVRGKINGHSLRF